MDLDPDVLAYYDLGLEDTRLTERRTLELLRTQVLLRRYLPPPPASVLDVGGASGVYAAWLADSGYTVHLVDPVALHREQAARRGGFTVAAGDARSLQAADATVDAVLLLGPLYHLTDRDDRLRALREAARVTRPGGVVLAAAISRYASVLDGWFLGSVDKPGFPAILRSDVATGQHRNPGGDPQLFTTAYFHDTAGLAAEVVETGLELDRVLPVEGPLHWAPGIAERLADPGQRALVLDVLAALEDDPAVTGATMHLLAAAHRRRSTDRRPSTPRSAGSGAGASRRSRIP